MPVQVVIFDLGGVVFDSPVEFLVSFEREQALPAGFLGQLLGQYSMEEGSWQRLERGEIDLATFCAETDARVAAQGHTVSTESMMRGLSQNARIRPEMLEAIRRLRGGGFRVAALTNNWVADGAQGRNTDELRAEFDLFVESCKVGMRKPEERIYRHTLEALDCAAGDAVFLDDIGGNLKTARRLGMHTIKVADATGALRELGPVVGLDLV